MGQLHALTKLNLINNQLEALPSEIGQLQALTKLNLINNQLEALPSEIGQLQALTKLDLSLNRLTVLLPEIGQLVALTELILWNNQLAAIPPEIGQLHALTELDLSANQLAVLPPEIGQLQALTEFAFPGNQLITLPDSICSLPATCVIYAQSNPFNPILFGQFQQRLLTHRANQPDQGPYIQFSILDDRNAAPLQTLTAQLQSWSQEFEGAFPHNEANAVLFESRATDLTPLTSSLTRDDADNLQNYLRRLRDTADYRNPAAHQNIALRVERMIQLACQNPEFKDNMLAQIATGLESCGDRVLITFNEIEIPSSVS